MSVEVRVYAGADPTDLVGSLLGTLAEDGGRAVSDKKNDAGAWAVAVPRDAAEAAWIQTYNVVRFLVGGTVCFSGRIGPRDQQTLDPGEEAREMRSIGGPGILDTLRDARVDPHPDVTLRHDTRYFTFAAIDYVDWGSWDPAVELFRQDDADESLYGTDVPASWPDPTAYWIWGTALSDPLDDPPQPIGKCYFRRSPNLTTTGDCALLIACDDKYRLFVDGVFVGENGEAHMFREYDRYNLFLEAGVHDIAIECENIARPVSSTNSAGLLFAMYRTIDGGVLDDLMIHSDDDWQVLAYPAAPPGMTPGEIMNVIIEEAQARGALAIWSVDFTDSLDSNGDAWDHELDITVRVCAEKVHDVLLKLAEADVDFAVDHETLTLRMFNKGGLNTGGAVEPEVGVDLLDLHHATDPAEATSLAVRHADGSLVFLDSGVPSEDADEPRIEAYIEAGSAPSSEAAERMAAAIFDLLAAPAPDVTFELHPDGPAPWVDIWPGKVITIPDDSLTPVSVEVQSIQIVDLPPADDGEEEGSYRVLVEAR